MDTGNLLSLFFGFQGRINRAKYWLAVAVYFAIAIVLTVSAITVGLIGGILAILIALIIYIPMLISGIAVGIKRLHDRGKSGWWLLLFYGLPAVLGWVSGGMGGGMILSLVSFVISIWAIVELGFLRGTPGANAYGPDPLNL